MDRKLVGSHVREHQNCILRTPDWKTKQDESSECCCKYAPCSHGVRKYSKITCAALRQRGSAALGMCIVLVGEAFCI